MRRMALDMPIPAVAAGSTMRYWRYKSIGPPPTGDRELDFSGGVGGKQSDQNWWYRNQSSAEGGSGGRLGRHDEAGYGLRRRGLQ